MSLSQLAYPKTLSEMRETARRCRNDAAALHCLGMMLVERADLNRALPYLQSAAAQQPSNARFQHDLADTLLARGRAADAGRAYRRVLESDASCLSAYHALGRLNRDPDEALGAEYLLHRAIVMEPANVESYRTLAGCCLREPALPAAMERMNRFLPPSATSYHAH